MIHLGDITKIDGSTAPVVDVIIGGSPCQDLSQAGKRAGLSGERSGLYMEQIRIIKEMRDTDVLRGRTGQFIRPRYMVWENVPGAFSCNKGKDFAAVLAEAVKVVEPEAPPVSVPEKGWPTSGCLHGLDGGWSIAWRVLDAQFWGVPQRRRRIALVADFGGMSAPEILFVRQSLSRDFEQGTEKRKEATGDAGKGIDKPVAFGISSYESNAMKSSNPHSGIYVADTSRTLDSGNCCNPACNQGGIAVVGFSAKAGAKAGSCGAEAEKAPSLLANRHDAAVVYDCRGNGNGRIVPTITGDHQSRVTDFTGIVLNDQGGERMDVSADGISPTIQAEMHGNIPAVLKSYQSVTGPLMANSHPGSYTGQDAYNDMLIVDTVGLDIYNGNVTGDVAASLTTATGQGASNTGPSAMQCYGLDSNKNGYTEKAGTLQSHKSGGMQELCCDRRMVVRRLTPLECERLQGFPDGWTDIGEWVDSKGKKHKPADTPRYKALGNSIALPPWKWVLKRLCAKYERDATMASLFDGIGGFPLLWEQLNGKGSCLWASEIEEFPMAVTKRRFWDG